VKSARKTVNRSAYLKKKKGVKDGRFREERKGNQKKALISRQGKNPRTVENRPGSFKRTEDSSRQTKIKPHAHADRKGGVQLLRAKQKIESDRRRFTVTVLEKASIEEGRNARRDYELQEEGGGQGVLKR